MNEMRKPRIGIFLASKCPNCEDLYGYKLGKDEYECSGCGRIRNPWDEERIGRKV
jgi:hypothetical protein